MLVLTMFPPQTMMKRLDGLFRIDCPLEAHGHFESAVARDVADGAVEAAGTQAVEEAAIHAAVVHQPHVAVVAVGQDGFRAVAADDFLHAPGDLIQGFLPGDAGEGAFALAAGPFQGMQHPVGVVYPGGKMRSEEHTSELQSRENLVCRLLLEKKKQRIINTRVTSMY